MMWRLLHGIIEVKQRAALGIVIEDLMILFETSKPEDLYWQIIYIPI